MRQFLVELIVVVTFVPRVSSGLADCDIPLQRRPLPGFVPRIVPAPDQHGIVVVWQDSETIHIQRFAHDCEIASYKKEVNSTRDFWRDPMESGLSDAVGLGDVHGSIIVAWTIDGEVWVRVIRYAGGSSSAAQRASGSGRYRRAEVRIVANPAGNSFAVAWSSWNQDGDGWGVYVRIFRADATPLGEEWKANTIWQHFQWRPQLAWCGNALWAVWLNGTDGSCPAGRGDACATGPFAKRFRPDGTDAGAVEVALHGQGPLAAAITCCGRPDCSEEDVSVYWLDKHATRVTNYTLRSKSMSSTQETPREVHTEIARRLDSRSRSSNSSLSQSSFLARVRDRALDSYRHFANLFDASEEIDVGRFVMTADSGLLVLMVNDGHGAVNGQLLDFLRTPAFAYPRREIASGIQSPRAAWANVRGSTRALVFCSVRVGQGIIEGLDSSSFNCMRREAQWLVDSGGLEFGGKLALVVVLSLIVVFCCFRHCAVVGRNQRGRFPGRLIGDEGRRSRRQASQTRIRELREQLAQIPVAMEQMQADAPGRPPARGSSDPSSPPSTGEALELDSPVDANIVRWTSRSVGDVCSICQNEVAVWVALRPCGHTACRECVSRIVEMNQRCHLCRNPIEGVLPVYI